MHAFIAIFTHVLDANFGNDSARTRHPWDVCPIFQFYSYGSTGMVVHDVRGIREIWKTEKDWPEFWMTYS